MFRVWWGIYTSLCYKFSTESNSERILKIGKYLVKLWARVRCLVFFDSQCICSIAVNQLFSARSRNPGRIPGLQNPQSRIQGLGKPVHDSENWTWTNKRKNDNATKTKASSGFHVKHTRVGDNGLQTDWAYSYSIGVTRDLNLKWLSHIGGIK